MHFKGKGKLPPRYVVSYEIVERVGVAAYCLRLPIELSRLHNVFHVSNLRKYLADHSRVLSPMELEVRKYLSYSEEPVRILDRNEQVLRSKSISLVKVLWHHHGMDESTWEGEEAMKIKYP